MREEKLRLGLLALTQLIVALDYNIVYVALPDIGRALGFTPQSVQWVVSAYAVGLGGLLTGPLAPQTVFTLSGIATLLAVAATAPGFRRANKTLA